SSFRNWVSIRTDARSGSLLPPACARPLCTNWKPQAFAWPEISSKSACCLRTNVGDTMNNPTMIIVLIGALVTFALIAVGFLITVRSGRSDTRLSELLQTRKAPTSGSHPGTQTGDIWREDPFESAKQNLIDNLIPKLPTMQKLFEQADVGIKPSALLGIGGVLATLGMLIAIYFGTPWYLVPVPGLFLFTLPWFWLLWRRKQRLKNFAAQLPDAMELLARALRAGQSLAAGLHIISEEMPDPIAKEFGRVYDEQNLGVALEDAMRAMCDRVPNLDLKFFVTAVNIQRSTGGDLAEILDKIGYVIRERYRILGQVKALTAEGRLSGAILLAMPPALFVIVLFINKQYVMTLFEDKEGIRLVV